MHHFAVSKNPPAIEEALFRANLHGLTTKSSPWIKKSVHLLALGPRSTTDVSGKPTR